MTREESIDKESAVYAWTANQFDIQQAFKRGAEWADEHPKPEMVNKKEFIEKACKWLKENLYEGYDPDNYPMVRCYDIDMEDFIKEFSRDMEE